MPDVKDQGVVNSCVAHSLATFMEESEKLNGIKFSVGWIYGYRPLGYYQNEGMYPRDAIKTLQKVGAVIKSDFDHNKELPEIKNLVDKDLDRLKALASLHKIKSYARIYTNEEIKECLLKDVPVPISVPVKQTLDLNNNNCVLLNENKQITGYHMMIIYGYDKYGWLIQNSWGRFWGNEGRATLPYDYPIDSAWAISTESNEINTYQSLWQKIYKFFVNLINKLKLNNGK